MSTLPTCANQANELITAGWSMSERVEHAASLFILENRQRIIGPEPFSAALCQETTRRLLLVTNFDKLAEVYMVRVKALLRVKGRIDHLRRSARALEAYKSRRLARLAMDHMLRDVFAELRARKAEEQGLLEGVFEVAADIVKLGRAK